MQILLDVSEACHARQDRAPSSRPPPQRPRGRGTAAVKGSPSPSTRAPSTRRSLPRNFSVRAVTRACSPLRASASARSRTETPLHVEVGAAVEVRSVGATDRRRDLRRGGGALRVDRRRIEAVAPGDDPERPCREQERRGRDRARAVPASAALPMRVAPCTSPSAFAVTWASMVIASTSSSPVARTPKLPRSAWRSSGTQSGIDRFASPARSRAPRTRPSGTAQVDVGRSPGLVDDDRRLGGQLLRGGQRARGVDRRGRDVVCPDLASQKLHGGIAGHRAVGLHARRDRGGHPEARSRARTRRARGRRCSWRRGSRSRTSRSRRRPCPRGRGTRRRSRRARRRRCRPAGRAPRGARASPAGSARRARARGCSPGSAVGTSTTASTRSFAIDAFSVCSMPAASPVQLTWASSFARAIGRITRRGLERAAHVGAVGDAPRRDLGSGDGPLEPVRGVRERAAEVVDVGIDGRGAGHLPVGPARVSRRCSRCRCETRARWGRRAWAGRASSERRRPRARAAPARPCRGGRRRCPRRTPTA